MQNSNTVLVYVIYLSVNNPNVFVCINKAYNAKKSNNKEIKWHLTGRMQKIYIYKKSE